MEQTPKPPAYHCSYSRLVAVSELREHPANPNRHPDEQVRLLAKVIAGNGWRSPIVVSKLSGYITKGHGRLLAAKAAGFGWAPVDFQDYENEAAEIADMIADNRMSEMGEMDRSKLKDALEMIDTGSTDMESLGYSQEALEEMMTEAPPEKDVEEVYTKKIIAPIYEPKGECPPLESLMEMEKRNALMKEIESVDMPDELKAFLSAAAERHTIFQFGRIAEYYAHAAPETQRLMENSGLVIIDFHKAIENGFVHLTDRLCDIAELEKESDEN